MYIARVGFIEKRVPMSSTVPMFQMYDDMQEKKIEQKLVKEVKRCGGKCWKFVSPGTDGVPDRIALLYKGKIGFVEVKAPGEDLRPQQKKRKKELEKLGFKVYVLDNEDEIGGIIDEIKNS